ncbi:Uncharacterised protein [Vibrio cholerae]|nr:Uncharacterised protein [Vibrio cholerae]
MRICCSWIKRYASSHDTRTNSSLPRTPFGAAGFAKKPLRTIGYLTRAWVYT